MPEGILLRGHGGFYDVRSNGAVWRCTLRGKHRWLRQDVLPGDRVRFHPLPGHKGTVEEVLPRQNRLIRPAVANVSQAIIVMSLAMPPVNHTLLDRLLVVCEASGTAPVLVFNKCDLAEDTARLLPLYRSLGYPVILTSAATRSGIEDLASRLKDNTSVFAGPSGVGKSSLLNAVNPGLGLKTGSVSQRIERGRHTTRYVNLLEVPGEGLVADTPGFSQIDLPPIKRVELAGYFPDISVRAQDCRFSSCLHRVEPGCAVREAMEAGAITRERYSHYLELLEEVIKAEHRY